MEDGGGGGGRRRMEEDGGGGGFTRRIDLSMAPTSAIPEWPSNQQRRNRMEAREGGRSGQRAKKEEKNDHTWQGHREGNGKRKTGRGE
eukprot:765065-Hanusia_phi.AAC.8